jgi:hypothetical protein
MGADDWRLVRISVNAPSGPPYSAVIAGLVPATPIMWHGGVLLSGVAGTSPAMTLT